ncbi:MAG: peptide-methionine (S)-S-oxide reductase MsrA [Candidatus Paceibacterota bacterium]
METAQFSMGCFWGPQYFFERLEGVEETIVGYAGGDSPDPHYHDLDGHTETIQIIFDPKKITYDELLTHFFNEHNPTEENKAQYKSIIFATTEAQFEKAKEKLDLEMSKHDAPLTTELRRAGNFFPAEEYHQQYLKKEREE